jgi:hypothetical protein
LALAAAFASSLVKETTMGWLFGWRERADMIHHLTRTNGVQTVRHCTVGNHLWAIQEYTKKGESTPTRFIALYLMQRHGGDWGYKDLCESEHPYYYTCPLAYLELAPEANAEWRAKVREHHTKRNRTLAPGQKITLYGKPYEVVSKLGPKSYLIHGGGQQYKITARHLPEVQT